MNKCPVCGGPVRIGGLDSDGKARLGSTQYLIALSSKDFTQACTNCGRRAIGMTIEQVREWFKNDIVHGHDEEHDLVKVIKDGLLTDLQRKRLYELDISIEDILNGRWEYTHERADFVDDTINDWNQRIGDIDGHKHWFDC